MVVTTPRPLGSPVSMTGRVGQCARLVRPGHRLLDVGCSSGWLSDVALDRGFVQYVGLEILISGMPPKRERVRFVAGSALDLPFEDRSFDAVALFDVIQDLPGRPELAALREAHRVLEPGGTLYLSAPHANFLHTPLDPVWVIRRRRHYRTATIRRMLDDAGFKPEELFVAGGIAATLTHLGKWVVGHVARRGVATPAWIEQLVDRGYKRPRRLGQTVFVAARPATRGPS